MVKFELERRSLKRTSSAIPPTLFFVFHLSSFIFVLSSFILSLPIFITEPRGCVWIIIVYFTIATILIDKNNGVKEGVIESEPVKCTLRIL